MKTGEPAVTEACQARESTRESTKEGARDLIDASRGLVCAVFLFSIACLAVMSAFTLLTPRPAAERARSIIGALDLMSAPLVPSGRPERALELHNPAIDLRHVPSLPGFVHDPVGLLLHTAHPREKESHR